MYENFEKIKSSIVDTCELYIPNPDGEFALHVDASQYGIVPNLEQQQPDMCVWLYLMAIAAPTCCSVVLTHDVAHQVTT